MNPSGFLPRAHRTLGAEESYICICIYKRSEWAGERIWQYKPRKRDRTNTFAAQATYLQRTNACTVYVATYTPYILRTYIHPYTTHQPLQTYQPYKCHYTLRTYPTPTYLPYIPHYPYIPIKPYIPTLPLHTYATPTNPTFYYAWLPYPCTPDVWVSSEKYTRYAVVS